MEWGNNIMENKMNDKELLNHLLSGGDFIGVCNSPVGGKIRSLAPISTERTLVQGKIKFAHRDENGNIESVMLEHNPADRKSVV